MDQVVIEIAKSAPALVVLVWLVWTQNKSSRERDRDFIGAVRTRDVKQENMQTRCHEVQDRATAAIAENSRVLGAVTEVVCPDSIEKSVRAGVRAELGGSSS